jgi:hypothetical protein
MHHPTRGGVRGGRDQFSWDEVKADKDRESYLGHTLMAPVGKWQQGRDLLWYSRQRGGESATSATVNSAHPLSLEERLREEREQIRREEEEKRSQLLGLSKPQSSVKVEGVRASEEDAEEAAVEEEERRRRASSTQRLRIKGSFVGGLYREERKEGRELQPLPLYPDPSELHESEEATRKRDSDSEEGEKRRRERREERRRRRKRRSEHSRKRAEHSPRSHSPSPRRRSHRRLRSRSRSPSSSSPSSPAHRKRSRSPRRR